MVSGQEAKQDPRETAQRGHESTGKGQAHALCCTLKGVWSSMREPRSRKEGARPGVTQRVTRAPGLEPDSRSPWHARTPAPCLPLSCSLCPVSRPCHPAQPGLRPVVRGLDVCAQGPIRSPLAPHGQPPATGIGQSGLPSGGLCAAVGVGEEVLLSARTKD